ncbi:MAG: DNA repair protein RadC [Sphingomonadales bacterium]|nr:DNA repair protein RadC [Sphingomonadales bacterium]
MNAQNQLQQLSDTALLNLVLALADKNKQQSQVMERTWRWHQQNWRTLAKSSHWDLLEIYGLDQQMAMRILGIFEICKRYQSEEVRQRRHIKTSKDVFDLLQVQLADLDHEQFFVLYLNYANEIIELVQLSIGGRHSTIADAKRIFQMGLRCAATGIILCHNHPSGQRKPSEQDLALTKDIKDFARLIDMKLLDHLIFTDNGYFSFADEGCL